MPDPYGCGCQKGHTPWDAKRDTPLESGCLSCFQRVCPFLGACGSGVPDPCGCGHVGARHASPAARQNAGCRRGAAVDPCGRVLRVGHARPLRVWMPKGTHPLKVGVSLAFRGCVPFRCPTPTGVGTVGARHASPATRQNTECRRGAAVDACGRVLRVGRARPLLRSG